MASWLRQVRRRIKRLTPEGRRQHAFTTRQAPPGSSVPFTLLGGGVPVDAGPRLVQVANFSFQAGDTLLPVTVRDVLSLGLGEVSWRVQHAHRTVGPPAIRQMNEAVGVIVGGGGLFLRDTNPNPLSGWQWSCSIDALSQITSPMALFAVGYNRFRGQPEFEPIFRDHLTELTDKSVFVGLRNQGSIEAVRRYLPAELHHKVRFQPCPTTLCALLYPESSEDSGVHDTSEVPFVALNCAFDRRELRYGDQEDALLDELALTMKRLSRELKIKYYAHNATDEQMCPHLDRAGVPYELVRLVRRTPGEILEAYRRPLVTVGMRGHAQMIPFGCGRPIVSLVTHDKLGYFLEDIGARDWGIELTDVEFAGKTEVLVRKIAEDPGPVTARIRDAQRSLWEVTQVNVADLRRAFALEPAVGPAVDPRA